MINKLAVILIPFICLAGCQTGKTDKGFYEWYTVDNEPRGSGTFRGSAGVLYKTIKMFEEQMDP